MKSFHFIAVFVAVAAVSASFVHQGQREVSSFLQHDVQITKSSELEPPGLQETPGLGVSVSLQNFKWPSESHLPKAVQYILVGVWVAMLASIPFIIPIMDHKSITKVQTAVGGSMLVILFGGFYLFTSVIQFQSVHFEQTRPLTVVECIYFMSQIITTVGYGDITPAKPFGQIFVCIYVIGALFIIAMLISDMTEHLVRVFEDYGKGEGDDSKHDNHVHTNRSSRRRGALHQHDASTDHSLAAIIKPVMPTWKPFWVSLATFATLDVLWILFFTFFPGEGKNFQQAVYMSVITLSTVGLGSFTPVTEEGMIFGAFMMLFGSMSLVNLITAFTELMVLQHKFEQFHNETEEQAITALRQITDGKVVTEVDFLKYILLQKKNVTGAQFDLLQQAFNALGPTDGKVSYKHLEDCLPHSQEVLEKQKFSA